MKKFRNLEKIIFIFFKKIIKIYQSFISPILPARCRYYPTCSNYGNQALDWHGGIKGSWLLLKRLGRCQPFGGHGIDFVPLPLNRFTYQVAKKPVAHNVGVAIDTFSYRVRLSRWLSKSR